jgi:hypothetical protein
MHEATEWHGVVWPESPSKDSAQEQVCAYERLKLEMERLKKHDDEQMFFRKELRARGGLSPILSSAGLLNVIYRVTSNYGNSVALPMIWLLVVFVFGAAIFAFLPLPLQPCNLMFMSVELAARISFANIFSFLPDKREIMTPEVLACWSSTARIVSAVQSLSGAVCFSWLALRYATGFV